MSDVWCFLDFHLNSGLLNEIYLCHHLKASCYCDHLFLDLCHHSHLYFYGEESDMVMKGLIRKGMCIEVQARLMSIPIIVWHCRRNLLLYYTKKYALIAQSWALFGCVSLGADCVVYRECSCNWSSNLFLNNFCAIRWNYSNREMGCDGMRPPSPSCCAALCCRLLPYPRCPLLLCAAALC